MKFRYIEKRVIIITTILVIGILSVIGIILLINQRKPKVVHRIQDENYIVTETFCDNTKRRAVQYEVRFYTGQQKSYVVKVKNDSIDTKFGKKEVVTKYREQQNDFTLDPKCATDTNIIDYCIELGFVYDCPTDVAQTYITNQKQIGKLMIEYRNKAYYQCYIKSTDNKITRFLFLQNNDGRTGTLLVAECKEKIKLDKIGDIVTYIESD